MQAMLLLLFLVRPIHSQDAVTPLIASPDAWFEAWEEYGVAIWASKAPNARADDVLPKDKRHTSLRYYAKAKSYLHMLSSMLTGMVAHCDFLGSLQVLLPCMQGIRLGHWDGVTGMVASSGMARMESIRKMVASLDSKKLRGAFLEAGVWRGGMSMFATAALHLYGHGNRTKFLCDSFEGLPKPRQGSVRPDEKQYARGARRAHLSVGEQLVMRNFARFFIPTHKVETRKGFFVDSLPLVRRVCPVSNAGYHPEWHERHI